MNGRGRRASKSAKIFYGRVAGTPLCLQKLNYLTPVYEESRTQLQLSFQITKQCCPFTIESMADFINTLKMQSVKEYR